MMNKLKICISILGILASTSSKSFPCNKYKFDLNSRVIQGDLAIRWSINTGFSGCTSDVEQINNARFIITIESLFQDILLKDTIESNFYRFSTYDFQNQPLIFNIKEFGDSRNYSTPIIPRTEELPVLPSKIDTLNFYLLNGNFLNALSILYDIKRGDLIDEIVKEYNILFPEYYPDNRFFYNHFIDKNSLKLSRVPFVDGITTFNKHINKYFRISQFNTLSFKVFAKVTPNNQLTEYEVIPKAYTELFEKLSIYLTFNNSEIEASTIFIEVGQVKNKKKLSVLNERALISPYSKKFKKNFRYRGVIQ